MLLYISIVDVHQQAPVQEIQTVNLLELDEHFQSMTKNRRKLMWVVSNQINLIQLNSAMVQWSLVLNIDMLIWEADLVW